MNQAASFGAEIAHMTIGVIAFWMAYRIGSWAAHRSRRLWLGWAAGILFLMPVGVFVGPILNQLDGAKCSGDAFPDDCMAGPVES